jgi:hypothetical protein
LAQVKAKKPPLGSMTDKQIVNLFTRFMEWWVDGRPGDPLKGGRQVSFGAVRLS